MVRYSVLNFRIQVDKILIEQKAKISKQHFAIFTFYSTTFALKII